MWAEAKPRRQGQQREQQTGEGRAEVIQHRQDLDLLLRERRILGDKAMLKAHPRSFETLTMRRQG